MFFEILTVVPGGKILEKWEARQIIYMKKVTVNILFLTNRFSLLIIIIIT